MVLSDRDIIRYIEQGDIQIQPLNHTLIRPASVCLRLGSEFLFLDSNQEIDVKDKDSYPMYSQMSISDGEGISIPPKKLVLANTLERIALSRNLAGWISNLSGLARLGLQVIQSNFITPGYGENNLTTLTLELLNVLEVPVRIYPGMRICHLIFFSLTSMSDNSYDNQVGTYSNQNEPRGSSFFLDFLHR